MKIAIAERKNSYSDYWIAYCKENNISYKAVNPYDSDIIEQVKDCDVFMWHHHHANYKDILFAKQLLFSLEERGLIVFPNFRTGWHFDDKLGQKYLFECLDILAAKAWVFYDKQSANEWLKSTKFPKVFKLRGGAGSSNVILAKDSKQAKKLINKAFGDGFSPFNTRNYIKDRWLAYKTRKIGLFSAMKSFARFFIKPNYIKQRHNEKGYIYFQEFIPNSGFDIRATVVEDKAIIFTRGVRKNDFRASASGFVTWNNENIDPSIVIAAFKVSRALNCQTISIDFVIDRYSNEAIVVEVSYAYGFPRIAGATIPNTPNGYWNSKIEYIQSPLFSPIYWMIEGRIREIERQNQFKLGSE